MGSSSGVGGGAGGRSMLCCTSHVLLLHWVRAWQQLRHGQLPKGPPTRAPVHPKLPAPLNGRLQQLGSTPVWIHVDVQSCLGPGQHSCHQGPCCTSAGCRTRYPVRCAALAMEAPNPPLEQALCSHQEAHSIGCSTRVHCWCTKYTAPGCTVWRSWRVPAPSGPHTHPTSPWRARR